MNCRGRTEKNRVTNYILVNNNNIQFSCLSQRSSFVISLHKPGGDVFSLFGFDTNNTKYDSCFSAGSSVLSKMAAVLDEVGQSAEKVVDEVKDDIVDEEDETGAAEASKKKKKKKKKKKAGESIAQS